MDAPVDSRRRHAAAVRIQAAVRRLIARGPLIDLVNAVYEKAYDESSGHFFYFNRKTGESTCEQAACPPPPPPAFFFPGPPHLPFAPL